MPDSAKATVDHHQHLRRQQRDPMDGGDPRYRSDGGDHRHDPPSSGVSCTICLELVYDNGGRSRAKLQCGHEFHLDCIGSAFNMKGAMQCPNCRTVERGQWLYANGSARSSNEFNMDDWISDDDFYDLSYSEMPFRVHWCPFGELARLGSSFEEGEPPSTTYHDSRGYHSLYTELSAAASVANSYIAYVGPIFPASSRSTEGVDDMNNHHSIGLSGRNEVFNAHTFPATNIQYHSWGLHSPSFPVPNSHISITDPASLPPFTLGSSNVDSDTGTRPTSFPHPTLFGNGSGPAAGSSFVSSVVPRHPVGSIWNQERMSISHPFHHWVQTNSSTGMAAPLTYGVRRFDGPNGLHMVLPALPPSQEQNGGFVVVPSPSSSVQTLHEAENPLPNHFQVWEMDHLSRLQHATVDGDSRFHSFHQPTRGSDSGNRAAGFWLRHSS